MSSRWREIGGFLLLVGGSIAGLVWGIQRYADIQVTTVGVASPVGDALKAKYQTKYSMGPEEWILRELLADRRDGIFVDVGAADARFLSNTYYFEQALDWSGIAIDPQVVYADGYATYRPRTRFRPFFVSDRSDAQVPFFVADQRESSSSDRQWAEGYTEGAVEEVTVSTVTLDDLLDREGITQIDLLSMDIEGHEPQALAGFSIDRFRPAVVVIEALEATRQPVLDYFTRHGYVLQGGYLVADPYNFYFRPLAP